jgi:hypothetical protein
MRLLHTTLLCVITSISSVSAADDLSLIAGRWTHSGISCQLKRGEIDELLNIKSDGTMTGLETDCKAKSIKVVPPKITFNNVCVSEGEKSVNKITVRLISDNKFVWSDKNLVDLEYTRCPSNKVSSNQSSFQISESIPRSIFKLNCRMDICDWSKIEDREIVGSSKQGVLIKSFNRHWYSKHPQGFYEKQSPKIGGKSIDKHFYFCSKTSPSVVWYNDLIKSWEAVSLQPINEIPTSVMYTSVISYIANCHGIVVSGDNMPNVARKLSYPGGIVPKENIKLTSPEEVLSRVN